MPRMPGERLSAGPAAARPRPSSVTCSTKEPGRERSSTTCTKLARACLRTLVSDSCATRYRQLATAGGSAASVPSGPRASNSACRLIRSPPSRTSCSMAAARPSSSSACGRNERTMRRTESTAPAAIACARVSAAALAAAGSGSARATCCCSIMITPSRCCRSSCSSRAMRRRSSSSAVFSRSTRRTSSRLERSSASRVVCSWLTSRAMVRVACPSGSARVTPETSRVRGATSGSTKRMPSRSTSDSPARTH